MILSLLVTSFTTISAKKFKFVNNEGKDFHTVKIPVDTTELQLSKFKVDSFPNFRYLTKLKSIELMDFVVKSQPEGSMSDLLPDSLESIITDDMGLSCVPDLSQLVNVKSIILKDFFWGLESCSSALADVFPVSLQELYIFGMPLIDVPNLKKLTRLRTLGLGQCGIPGEMTPMSEVLPRGLTKLALYHGCVTVPPDITGLTELSALHLNGNFMMEFPGPGHVGPQNKLVTLDLRRNQLFTLPDLCLYPHLRKLLLSENFMDDNSGKLY